MFRLGVTTPPLDQFAHRFSRIAERFNMVWGLHDAQRRERLLILVSKLDHCLNDLLYRYRTGDLHVEIAAVVSNHPDLEPLVRWHGIPFHCFVHGEELTLARTSKDLTWMTRRALQAAFARIGKP